VPNDHLVEAELKLADLRAVVDRDADVEVALLDATEGAAEPSDRIGGRTGGEDHRDQADHQPRSPERDHCHAELADAHPLCMCEGERADRHQACERNAGADGPGKHGASSDTGHGESSWRTLGHRSCRGAAQQPLRCEVRGGCGHEAG
jgi:hypothetical protein